MLETRIPMPFLPIFIIALFALPGAIPCRASTESDSAQAGTIILNEEIARQIDDIERLLKSDPDMKAERQSALLTWLSELYDSTSQFDEAEKCYVKILSFFPYDVGTLNRYARFLLERKRDAEKAFQQLKKARFYFKPARVKAIDRGLTELLLGKVEMTRNNPDIAKEHFKRSIALFEENSALQISALSAFYDVQSRSHEYDGALATYLRIVGMKKSYDDEDIKEIERLISLSKAKEDEDARALAIRAIKDERKREELGAEELGATLETILLADGYKIDAVFYRRSSDGAVLLIPSPGGSRSSYRVLSQLLASSDISCLSLESIRIQPPAASFPDMPPAGGAASGESSEIYAGVKFLRDALGTEDEKIVIVAAGRNSEAVERAIYNYRLRCPVLYLSPIFDRSSRYFANALAFRQERPSYLIYSLEDRLSILSVSFFRNIKPQRTLETLSLEKAGHGEEMLQLSSKALEASYDWIEKTLSRFSR